MRLAGQNGRIDYDLGLEQRWKLVGIARVGGNGVGKRVLHG